VKVGFIGLGTMGQWMALNLQKAGHEMVVSDIRREAADGFIERGARWASTPSEVAAESEVVFTSVPGPPEVKAVALGPNGLIEGYRPGGARIDLSTSSPTLIREIHARFVERDLSVLDAPVSGGPPGAQTGKLAIWVGGDEAKFQQYLPLLKCVGDQVAYVGPVGAGLVTKLVHNTATFTIQAVMAEVFTLGVKAGVDPLELWKAVRQGASGRRRTFDRLPDQFLQGEFEPAAFMLKLAQKDLTLAADLAEELDVPMALSSLGLQELTDALNRGWGNQDARVAMLLQEERAKVEIKVPDERVKATLKDNPV
jgi:3-hydroxyisobutyrate dehydrogenase